MSLSIESPFVRDAETLLATPLGTVRRASRTYSAGRVCASPDCKTWLSIYNPGPHCWIHELAEADGLLKAGHVEVDRSGRHEVAPRADELEES